MRYLLKQLVQQYLRLLTKIVIWRHQPIIIAVTGISNKTTTKMAIVERLRRLGIEARANPRSFNTEIGLPLAVLYIEPQGRSVAAWIKVLWQGTIIALLGRQFPKMLVLEFGISQRGDMKKLLNIVKPQAAVFTNVVLSDFNPQTTIDELTQEMIVLARAIPKTGLAVLNIDDVHLRSLIGVSPGQSVTYGFGEGADIRAVQIRQESDGLHWQVDNREYTLAKFGEHHLIAELAAEALIRHAHIRDLS